MNGQHQPRGAWRARWAAVGAAVAISIGGGGLFVASAAGSTTESSFVPVDPVRVVDSRVGVGVAGPLSSLADQDVKITGTVTTTTGAVEVVPTGANGVVLNLTVIRPTARGFISVRPGGSTGTAATSSLNFESGATVANSVTVSIPTSGPDAGELSLRFDAFGAAGPTAGVAIDVVGYTTNATLARLDAGQLIASAGGDSTVVFSSGDNVFQTVELTAPTAGNVFVSSSVGIFNTNISFAGHASCSIDDDGTQPDVVEQLASAPPFGGATASGSRVFTVVEGETLTVDLVCSVYFGSSSDLFANDASLTALFVAS
jgi:hypothetical protein